MLATFPHPGDEIVTKTYSSWTLAVAAAVGVCALAGCNQRESAQETANDVAEERQDAQENVAEERREAAETATDNMEDRAAAEYDVAVAQADTVPGRRRHARYGLNVQFESRPDDPELARLVESTIWINAAHPAYTRAAASRSTGYHTALSVALALAPLAVEPAGEHAFVTQFMAQWGRGARGRRA